MICMMNDNVEGLSFSREALSNRSLFLAQLNDINIYVEDVGKEYEYEEIFERLFENNLNIFSIFPLGGKEAVIKGHQSKGLRDSNGKLNIFIVDGDFNNLWDDQKIISPNLIYLTRYNIESYYCSKEAVIKFIRSFLKCTRNEAEAKIHFDAWQQSVRDGLGRLFVLFAIVKRHRPELPNVKLGTGKFLDENGCLIAEEYENYYQMVSQEIGSTDTHIEQIRERIHTQFNGNEDDKVLSVICGKYQFESLCRQLRGCCRKNINREIFRTVLISNFDIQHLSFLKDKILQLMADNLLESNSA